MPGSNSPERSDGALPAQVDIAIIGSGLTGLCLALFLARQQTPWSILLLEPSAGRSGHERETALEPSFAQTNFHHRQIALAESSRRLFVELGLWSEIEAHTAAITDIHVSDRGHLGHSRLIAAEQGLDAYGYVISAAKLADLLSTALEKLTSVRRVASTEGGPGQQTINMRSAGRGMIIELGESAVCAQLAALANGEAPDEAQRLGIQFERKSYDRIALSAELSLQEPHRGIAYERFTSEGPVALLPLRDRDALPRAGLVWTLSSERAEQLFTMEDELFLDQLQQSFGDRAGPITGVSHRALVPLSKVIATEQVRRHLVLMGSAAHSLHPVAGQGFNLTLRDIAALCEVLADAKANGSAPGDLAALQRYEQGRAVDQTQVVGFSDVLPGLFASTNPLLTAGRNLGLLGLELAPGLRGAVARFGAGLMARGAKQ